MNCSVEEAKVKISDLLGDRIDIAESIANILENEVKDKIVFDTQNVKDQKILGVSLSTIPDRKSYSDNLHINHTGGAYGADSIFADEFRKYGVVTIIMFQIQIN